MDISNDLHICGACRKIFNDIKQFLDHKSICELCQGDLILLQNTQDISLENGLFPIQTELDFSVLETEPFLFDLPYDNEEVVSDNTLQPQGKVSTESTDFLLSNGLIIDNNTNEYVDASVVSTRSKDNKIQHLKFSKTQQSKRKLEKSCRSNVNIYQNILPENGYCDQMLIKSTTMNKKEPHVCKICNFKSSTGRDLIRHMRRHTGERPFACFMCGKKFARQDKLVTHKRIHTGDKRYKCQLCDYASTDGAALRKHIQIHSDSRPHKCQICSYQARSSSHMILHLRTHTGDSPFFCQLETCGRTFKTSADLKRHSKTHKHPTLSPAYSCYDEISEDTSRKHLSKSGDFRKKSSCHICLRYTHKGGMKKERGPKRKRRGGLVKCKRVHECSHCKAAFVRYDSLRSHLRQHHQTSFPTEETSNLDGDAEEENYSDSNQTFTMDSPSELLALQDPVVLSLDNASCLQDSVISLDHNSIVQLVIESTLI